MLRATTGTREAMAKVNRLLERETALAELDRCRRAAARGGRIVLVRGEAGVGKTTVIARFYEGLGLSTPVVRGWCDALATPRPLGPLIDMLDGVAGERAARVRAAIDAGDAETIYARLVDLLGDGARWVGVIEDLHWADGATLDLVRYLARRIEALPVLLVVSYRDDGIGALHPLAVWLGDLATSAAVTRIALNALSAAAVGQLAVGSGVNAQEFIRSPEVTRFSSPKCWPRARTRWPGAACRAVCRRRWWAGWRGCRRPAARPRRPLRCAGRDPARC